MNSEIKDVLRDLALAGYFYNIEVHPFIKNLYWVKFGETQVYNGSYNMVLAYLRGILTGLALDDELANYRIEE